MSFELNSLRERLIKEVGDLITPHIDKGQELKFLRTNDGFKYLLKNSENQEALLLLVKISVEQRSICVPNIYFPEPLRRRGIGFGILSLIYKAGKEREYSIFITELVQSFFERLKTRGAKVINNEVVELVESTNLLRSGLNET